VITDTGGLVSEIDTVTINARLPNSLVVADPGEDRDEIESTMVQLYGSGSAPEGIDNSTTAFEWKQLDITPENEVTLVFDPSHARFTPSFMAPEVTGTDPIDIKLQLIVFDNQFGFSEPEVVVITIYPTGTTLDNDPPTAFDQEITINRNGSLASVTLSGDDPDGDNAGLRFEVFTQPDDTKGEISSINNFSDGRFVQVFYKPKFDPLNFPVVGNSFTYIAIDQDGEPSAPATVTFIPITPENDIAPFVRDLVLDIPPTSNGPETRYNLEMTDPFDVSTHLVTDEDAFVILEDEANIDDSEMTFRLCCRNRLLIRSRSNTATNGTFSYRAVDIFGNVSEPATITVNFND